MTRSSGRRRRTTRLARLVVPVPAERFAACSTATTSTAGSWVGQGSFVVANGALQAAPAGTWDCCGIPARPRPTSSCAANGDSPRPTTTPRCCERHSLVWTPGLPRRLEAPPPRLRTLRRPPGLDHVMQHPYSVDMAAALHLREQSSPLPSSTTFPPRPRYSCSRKVHRPGRIPSQGGPRRPDSTRTPGRGRRQDVTPGVRLGVHPAPSIPDGSRAMAMDRIYLVRRSRVLLASSRI